MKLIYTQTGKEVKVGDQVRTFRSELVEVMSLRKPHKAASSGFVSIKAVHHKWSGEYYVGVIGAEWIDRGDR